MKGKSGGGYIMSDKICSSADKVLEVFLENAPMDTSHHRMVKQQNKCGYGLQGVCCRLCSNGPCRLSPAKPKGLFWITLTARLCTAAKSRAKARAIAPALRIK